MSNILNITGRSISYKKVYKEACSSLHGGILISQLMYWWSRETTKENTVYKTNDEMMKELGFTEREMKTAKTSIKKVNWIEIFIKKINGNPTTHYKINLDLFEKEMIGKKETIKIEIMNNTVINRMGKKEFERFMRTNYINKPVQTQEHGIIAISKKGTLYNVKTTNELAVVEAYKIWDKLYANKEIFIKKIEEKM